MHTQAVNVTPLAVKEFDIIFHKHIIYAIEDCGYRKVPV